MLHRRPRERGHGVHEQENVVELMHGARDVFDVLKYTRGCLRMHDRHRVDGRAPQRVTHHVGLHRRAKRYVEPHHFLAGRRSDHAESLAEAAVHDGQHAASHAVAHRHFHEPGGRAGADQDGPRGAAESLEARSHGLEQRLHGAGAVADHGALHRGHDFGMNVGGAGKKELTELGQAALAFSASAVVTSRTPRRCQSDSNAGAASWWMGFMASVTA